jgi:hypothetical protein
MNGIQLLNAGKKYEPRRTMSPRPSAVPLVVCTGPFGPRRFATTADGGLLLDGG